MCPFMLFSHSYDVKEDKYLTSFNLTLMNDSRLLKCYIWPEENRIPVIKCVCGRAGLNDSGVAGQKHSKRSWDA